jgi:hypothetical protein
MIRATITPHFQGHFVTEAVPNKANAEAVQYRLQGMSTYLNQAFQTTQELSQLREVGEVFTDGRAVHVFCLDALDTRVQEILNKLYGEPDPRWGSLTQREEKIPDYAALVETTERAARQARAQGRATQAIGILGVAGRLNVSG